MGESLEKIVELPFVKYFYGVIAARTRKKRFVPADAP
jgi:hypothetical protein